MIDGKTAIPVEVKVARVHRVVYATGAEAKFDECIDPIRTGLGQLFEFGQAAAQRVAGLARLSQCKDFINVVVTWEPVYLSSSVPFKDRLRESLPPEMRGMDWAC